MAPVGRQTLQRKLEDFVGRLAKRFGEMRGKLSGLGLGDVQIQSFGAESDVLIRIEQQPGGEPMAAEGPADR